MSKINILTDNLDERIQLSVPELLDASNLIP
jgi:hypothetical protein